MTFDIPTTLGWTLAVLWAISLGFKGWQIFLEYQAFKAARAAMSAQTLAMKAAAERRITIPGAH